MGSCEDHSGNNMQTWTYLRTRQIMHLPSSRCLEVVGDQVRKKQRDSHSLVSLYFNLSSLVLVVCQTQLWHRDCKITTMWKSYSANASETDVRNGRSRILVHLEKRNRVPIAKMATTTSRQPSPLLERDNSAPLPQPGIHHPKCYTSEFSFK